MRQIVNNRDTSKHDLSLLASIKSELKEASAFPTDNGQNKSKKFKSQLPSRILHKSGKALQP